MSPNNCVERIRAVTRPSVFYYMTRPEEPTGMPGPYIPTFGHIASAVDVYRAVAVAEVRDHPESWCFTDMDSAAALGRVVEGPILSRADIAKAETALRAILLHEVVDIVVPCVKAKHSTGFSGYARFDKDLRNQAAFEAMNAAPCCDHLLAVESIEVRDGEIVESTNPNSHLLGRAFDAGTQNFAELTTSAATVANAFPMQLRAASHFSASAFVTAAKASPAGFIDDLYERIERPWMTVAQAEPALFVDLKLPPLIAVVLTRAGHRADIPAVLRELREELAPVRVDLIRVNRMLDSAVTQADLHAQVRRIHESFDAIVPEALMTDAERRWRRITSVFDFARPLRQIYSAAVDPLAADADMLIEIFNSTREAVLRNRRIVSRSVPAATFAELLRVDAARDLVTSHFSANEIALFAAAER